MIRLNKVFFATVTIILLLSSVSIVNFTHSAFAQQKSSGTSASSKHPVEVGKGDYTAGFQVIKKVVGGTAQSKDFNFIITLSGPSGSATYSLQYYSLDSFVFYLNLPKGSTLSEGNYQITETNPGDYTPSYSKGCSGTYDVNGYWYTCVVTNTKKVVPSTTTSVAKGGTPPPQPGITHGKTTLPTTSNTGKLTLPITPIKPTITLPTTSGKSTGTITPKPPVVHSCPVGSILANGKCISKGKVVGVLQ